MDEKKNEHKVPYDLLPLCKRYHSVLQASIVDRDKERGRKRHHSKAMRPMCGPHLPPLLSLWRYHLLPRSDYWLRFWVRFLAFFFSYCFLCRGGREVAASSLGRGSGAATGNVYGGQWKTVIYTRARAHKHRSKLGLRVHSTFRGHEPAEQTETKLNYNQTHIAHRFVCGACNKSEQVNGALRLRVWVGMRVCQLQCVWPGQKMPLSIKM